MSKKLGKHPRILDDSSEDEFSTPQIISKPDKLDEDLTSLFGGLNLKHEPSKGSRFDGFTLGLDEPENFAVEKPCEPVKKASKVLSGASTSTSKPVAADSKAEVGGMARYVYIPSPVSLASLSEEMRALHELQVIRVGSQYSQLKMKLAQGNYFSSSSTKQWAKKFYSDATAEPTVTEVDAGLCLQACMRLLLLAMTVHCSESGIALLNDMAAVAHEHVLDECLLAILPVHIDMSPTQSLQIVEGVVIDLSFMHLLGSVGYPVTLTLHQIYAAILGTSFSSHIVRQQCILLPRGSVTYSDRLLTVNIVTNNFYVLCPTQYQECVCSIIPDVCTDIQPLLLLAAISSRVYAYIDNTYKKTAPCSILQMQHPDLTQLQLRDALVIVRTNLSKLYFYQRQCVLWLHSVLHRSDSGALLGDDMGLGKTVQLSTYQHSGFFTKKFRRALVVLPVSVVANWVKELEFWCPGVEVQVMDDKTTKIRRVQMIIDIMKSKNKILLTSYGMITFSSALLSLDHSKVADTIANDELKGTEKKLMIELHDQLKEKYESGSAFKWDIAIFDEAHKLKNIKTQVSSCVRTLNCRRRLLLSGTPIQNNLSEMWALTDYYSNGTLLGDYDAFKLNVIKHVELGTMKDATDEQRNYSTRVSNELHKVLSATMLRRTKAMFKNTATDILPNVHAAYQLTIDPQLLTSAHNSVTYVQDTHSMQKNDLSSVIKTDLTVWVYQSDTQRKIYGNTLENAKKSGVFEQSTGVQPLMTYLKCLCNSPNIVRNWKLNAEIDEDGVDLEDNGNYLTNERVDGDDMVDVEQRSHLVEQGWNEKHLQWISESGKMMVLIELLSELFETGHRVLLFSQSNRTLDMLEQIIQQCPQEYRTQRIDGTVHSKERQRRVDQFNSDPSYFLFLLNTKTGGEGLNLTGADRVILFDPSWNPTSDSQAIDRAYRLGQRKHVVVYRLISCGTVEEVMYRKQVFKQGLIDNTLEEQTANRAGYFSREELSEVLNLFQPLSSSTCDSLTEQHPVHKWKQYKELTQHLYFLTRGTSEERNSGVDAVVKQCIAHESSYIDPVSSCLGFSVYGVTDHSALYSDKTRLRGEQVPLKMTIATPKKNSTRPANSIDKKAVDHHVDVVDGSNHHVRGSLQSSKKTAQSDSTYDNYNRDDSKHAKEAYENPRKRTPGIAKKKPHRMQDDDDDDDDASNDQSSATPHSNIAAAHPAPAKSVKVNSLLDEDDFNSDNLSSHLSRLSAQTYQSAVKPYHKNSLLDILSDCTDILRQCAATVEFHLARAQDHLTKQGKIGRVNRSA